jgi:hypothetical protein
VPPAVRDYRLAAFDAAKVDACGRQVGRRVYWKLYAIENIVRVTTNTVLAGQLGASWWSLAVDPNVRRKIQKRMADYANSKSMPGKHDLYYALLTELTKIVANNSNVFRPLIPDIDHWVARLEDLRLPRNVVGHMNWPNVHDRQQIDTLYVDLQVLVKRLAGTGMSFGIP